VAAFRLGRCAAVDPAALEHMVTREAPAATDSRRLSQSLDEVIARREAFLTAYQNQAYAERYRSWVNKVRLAETAQAPGKEELTDAVARTLFKLMAYKDEYEVARLYTDPAFRALVKNEVAGERLRLRVHLSPPLLARRDPVSGRPRKMTFGAWIFPAFHVLAKLKVLRGTAFDPFGWTQERRTERQLIADYETLLKEVLARLSPENHHLAVGLVTAADKIRGFGFIKLRSLKTAKADEAALLERFRTGAPMLKAAE
jgi:indolepyruvate ferredoxin oxidoreductase